MARSRGGGLVGFRAGMGPPIAAVPLLFVIGMCQERILIDSGRHGLPPASPRSGSLSVRSLRPTVALTTS